MTALTKAVFTVQSGTHRNTRVDVHFNPVSLQYAVSNTLEEKGSGSSKKQYVSQSSGKLTMDLVFDTTHDGSDVRRVTDQIAQFMEPDAQKVPPIVLFEWGTYKFQGMVESYKETIDFFAPNGVPLRASVNLTLSRQDKVFEPSSYSKFDQNAGLTPDAVDVPAAPVPGAPGGGSGQDATNLAAQAGNPQGGRALAAANSLESMRFPSGPLTVDASITLGPPVAFASGGAGLSLGAGGGFDLGAGIGGSAGISAGAGIGGSAGFSAGAGAGFSTGAGIGGSTGFSAGASVAIGGRSSAGVSATGGAFAGLQSGRSRTAVSLDPSRLLPPPPAAGVTTGAGTSFQLGGQISGQGSSSLRADVGADVDLRSRLQFQER